MPWGSFCFLSLPTGLNESMDSFNICTDFITSNIPKTVKSVDDILGQGQNPQELYNQIITVLTRIIQHKFKISKKVKNWDRN